MWTANRQFPFSNFSTKIASSKSFALAGSMVNTGRSLQSSLDNNSSSGISQENASASLMTRSLNSIGSL